MKPYYEHGNQTIYLGDCREILPQLGRFDLLLTDPPYGMNYKHGGRRGGLKQGFDGVDIIGDEAPFDPAFLFDVAEKVILWGANHYASRLPDSRGWIVWDKRDGIAPNDQSDCEIGWTNFMTVARLFTRYWNGGGIGEKRYHVSQKPINLMKWCLSLSPDSRSVLDPFLGSGTTLVACKAMGLTGVGIELHEPYAEIAAKRLSQEVFDFGAA